MRHYEVTLILDPSLESKGTHIGREHDSQGIHTFATPGGGEVDM